MQVREEGEMYIWFGIALALAFSGLIESLLGFDIPFLVLRSIMLFLLVLGMAFTYYRQEQSSTPGDEPAGKTAELVDEQV
jgi:membrane protein implicated in regulation of membrane protease activity